METGFRYHVYYVEKPLTNTVFDGVPMMEISGWIVFCVFRYLRVRRINKRGC
jgi:hypothetical protein